MTCVQRKDELRGDSIMSTPVSNLKHTLSKLSDTHKPVCVLIWAFLRTLEKESSLTKESTDYRHEMLGSPEQVEKPSG